MLGLGKDDGNEAQRTVSGERTRMGRRRRARFGVGKRILGLNEKEIARTRGSDERKVAIAKLIWERTAVSQGWIASQLGCVREQM